MGLYEDSYVHTNGLRQKYWSNQLRYHVGALGRRACVSTYESLDDPIAPQMCHMKLSMLPKTSLDLVPQVLIWSQADIFTNSVIFEHFGWHQKSGSNQLRYHVRVSWSMSVCERIWMFRRTHRASDVSYEDTNATNSKLRLSVKSFNLITDRYFHKLSRFRAFWVTSKIWVKSAWILCRNFWHTWGFLRTSQPLNYPRFSHVCLKTMILLPKVVACRVLSKNIRL